MIAQMTFGQLITDYRERTGRTQESLAQEVGCTSKAIRNVEKGITSSLQKMFWPRLAKAIGVTVEELAEAARESAAEAGLEDVKYDEMGRNWQKVLEEAKRFGLTPEQVRDAIRRTRPPDQTQGS
jgi:transcriptional regulator with XRE-family HTH domain